MSDKKILIIVTNHTDFMFPKADPTGLWLSELTHFYDVMEKAKIKVTIASLKGGKIEIDSRSLGRMVLDKATKQRHQDAEFMALLENTPTLADIEHCTYDALYFAGGHGAMWDFADDGALNAVTREMYESRKIVAAVCHGVAALQNTKLSNGKYLIDGKKGTGFAYFDEGIAGVKKLVPYNLQKRLKERGMKYSKAFLPLSKHVVVDGNLITGQNPNSAIGTAEKTLELLSN